MKCFDITNNIFYFLIIVLKSAGLFSNSDVEELIKLIYPKLNHLSSGKSVYFCNNFCCTYDSAISSKLNGIFNDSKKNIFVYLIIFYIY